MTVGIAEQAFTATGQTDWLQVSGDFNISVDFTTGSGVGTVILERSFDGVTAKPGVLETCTDDTEKVGSNPENIFVRLRCSAFTSGTIAARLSY